jgi:hypothetical protein
MKRLYLFLNKVDNNLTKEIKSHVSPVIQKYLILNILKTNVDKRRRKTFLGTIYSNIENAKKRKISKVLG